jgi:hypothetical protein
MLSAFTQSGILATARGGHTLRVLTAIAWLVKELTDERIRVNHRSYESGSDRVALGVGEHTKK